MGILTWNIYYKERKCTENLVVISFCKDIYHLREGCLLKIKPISFIYRKIIYLNFKNAFVFLFIFMIIV